MYRLEEGCSGAELGLALALLRAWVATDSKPEGAGNREWLSKVSPICLQMIETALKQNARPSLYAVNRQAPVQVTLLSFTRENILVWRPIHSNDAT